MPVITLTTDFGLKDHFVAQVKGRIFTLEPSATIVDISHQISPFNFQETAYVLKSCFTDFPDKSVHLIGVNSTITPASNHLVVKAKGHYFVGANNGIIPAIAAGYPIEEAVAVTAYADYSDFPLLETFTKIGIHLLHGGSLQLLGRPLATLISYPESSGILSEDASEIRGEIIHIDHFGNLVTNIKKVDVDARRFGRSIRVQLRNYQIDQIYASINSFESQLEKGQNARAALGKHIAHYTSSGHLQISIYKGVPGASGSAESLLGMSLGSTVNLLFISESEKP